MRHFFVFCGGARELISDFSEDGVIKHALRHGVKDPNKMAFAELKKVDADRFGYLKKEMELECEIKDLEAKIRTLKESLS